MKDLSCLNLRGHSLSQQSRHASRIMRQPVTLCHQSKSERNEHWCSAHSLLLNVVWCLNPWDGAATFKMDLPSSAERFWKHPHRYTQRYASTVILNLVEMTMKINHHTTYCSIKNQLLRDYVRIGSNLCKEMNVFASEKQSNSRQKL